MDLPELSSGCLMTIMSGAEYDKEPILQVLGTKKIAGGSTERYRLLLSDGKYLQSFSMLSTQLNHLVLAGELSENTIIQVKQHITSLVNKNDNDESRRVLIIVALEVLKSGDEVGVKLGDPISLTDLNKANVAAQKPAEPEQKLNPLPQARTQPRQQQSQSMDTSTFDGRATHPISGLSPYQNKWVIKARVTAKSAMRSWSNAKGEGKLFSFDLMDESGQIRVTAFRDVAEKYFDMIEVDKVYFISKAQLKPANKQYSNLPNDYEMTLNSDSVIQECVDAADDIPAVQYDFVPISQLAEMENNRIVDVIGVCRDVGEVQRFTAKASGRELKKRDITLVDNSNASINVTLWGKDAEDFNDYGQPVLLIKSGKINEFNGGKTISLLGNSVLKRNPDCVEGHRLRGWFDNGGASSIQASVSARVGGGNYATEWLTFEEAKMKNLGNGDKPDYFQVKATVHLIRTSNAFYKACPTPDCNKKVVDMENGHYSCEKCAQQFTNFKYRLMLSMSIGDWTSNRWVTCFANEAEKMLGKSSDEVGEMYENNKDDGNAFFAAQHFRNYIFKLRTKVEFYGDSSRNKITVQAVNPINYKEYNDYLVKNIQRLTGVGKR